MNIATVIPTYNRAAVVGEAIESVLCQTRPSDEIIVVDDGSTDDTPRLLESFGDRIRVIRQENAGVSAARNAGVRAARGDWIALLDSDDEWDPEKLRVQAEQLAAYPNAVGHSTNLLFRAPDHLDVDLYQMLGVECGQGAPMYFERPLFQALASMFPPISTVMRRSSMLEAGLFDESISIYEDFDLIVRVAVRGPWVVDSRPLAIAYRKTDPEEALSAQQQTSPLAAHTSGVVTYQKLLQIEGLSLLERARCRRGLANAHFMCGCVLADQGERWRSLQQYRASLMSSPTPKALAKVAIAVLGGAGGRGAIRRRYSRGFRRSEAYRSTTSAGNKNGPVSRGPER